MQTPAQNDHPLVVFKTSRIHGTGGFARRDLQDGMHIIEYVGPPLAKTAVEVELAKHNVYIFTLDDGCDIDGSVEWNMARFLNHSCEPNCEVKIVHGHVWICARRAIQAGEELTYNYGYSLKGYEDRPCRCGAPTCVGYMVNENLFATVRQRQPTRPSRPSARHRSRT